MIHMKDQKKKKLQANIIQFVEEKQFFMRQIYKENKKQNQQLRQEIQFEEDTKKYVHQIVQKKNGNKSFEETEISFCWSELNSQHLIYALRSSLSTNINNKLINPQIIKQLNLSDNQICDNGVKQLCSQQYYWRKLQKLQLSWNSITMKGIQFLSRAAQMKRFPQLSILYLQVNKLGGQDDLFQSIQNNQQSIQEGLLLKFTGDNTKLAQLYLSSNVINDYDMLKLFKYPQKKIDETNKKRIFHDLKILHLYRNNITKNGIKIFTQRKLKQQYPSLKNLFFGSNKINKDGIKYLINSMNTKTSNSDQANLNESSKLQILSLSNNNLCSQAIKIFSSNRNNFKNLIRLDLFYNILIGDKGIQNFMKAYQEGAFPSLKILDIRNINLSDKGVEKIIKQYYSSKTLVIETILMNQNDELLNLQQIKKKLLKRVKQQVKINLE